MTLVKNYSVEIVWSAADELYLAQVRELPGCIADGTTREEALKNILQIAGEWIEVAKEEGRQIPEPLTVEALEQQTDAMSQDLPKKIEENIVNAGHLLDAALKAMKEGHQLQRHDVPAMHESAASYNLVGKKTK